MGITFGEAMRNIFSFIIGTRDANSATKLLSQNVVCKKCGSPMHLLNKLKTDFIILEIYTCPECSSITEFQYESESNELIRESYVYDNKISSRSSIITESEGYIKYENFSLDKLWVVCGHLCYPALIKSEFTDKSSLIFVKCENEIALNCVDGFIINAQNVVGEIRIFSDQNISHFYNPYLSRLPHKDFHYMSYPTPRCSALEAVDSIRFDHVETGHNGVYMHKLTIIKDMPLRASGIEVYIKFYSFGEKLHRSNKIMKYIKGIKLRDIIMGKTSFETTEEYSIQSFNVNKHTISSVNRIDISMEERLDFYNDIVKFFEVYDQYNLE